LDVLLEKEIEILRQYAIDDFVWKYETENEPGWKNNMSHTWIKGFYRICNMDENTFLKLLYELANKNIIKISDNTFWLTDYGKKVFEGLSNG
jgi:hypothetical protein